MYAATKAALNGLTLALRYELWEENIRVTSATPGTTATAICHPIDEGERASGFWNGATVPLGYKLVEAEKRGTKIKKLAIDPVEAETARLIFTLYLHGDGNSGALGVKEVVKWLNGNGYRTRRGETFAVGSVHKILTNTVNEEVIRDEPARPSESSRCVSTAASADLEQPALPAPSIGRAGRGDRLRF